MNFKNMFVLRNNAIPFKEIFYERKITGNIHTRHKTNKKYEKQIMLVINFYRKKSGKNEL